MSKVEFLQSVPIFSDLSDETLKKISGKMVSRSYDKGQMILLEDSAGETFFVMTSGSVKVTRLSDDGREVILAILGEGDFFGEMSLLDGEGRSANIVSIDDSEVLTLTRADFLEILESFPKIAISFLEELARRLRKSDQQIESLSLADADKRIGMVVVRLAEELGTIKQGNVSIKNFPYQQDIANMAGTSRETVSRTLSVLEDNGYLARKAKTLTIYNFDFFQKHFS
ncbi:MAG: Crp/Fnr family transcriptional regulator [Candidatus Marinimicrobia bacterium]|jgi:CRP-like cAMP-binding protein|nr:Crp/Fnr family transcriptional regulator [Candidatus Neomarinimicrobiota bacterium]MDP7072902.1 Crp/Fnr family transcriptional regulator [Candidatus Neomarinimicrobiota bacterium]